MYWFWFILTSLWNIPRWEGFLNALRVKSGVWASYLDWRGILGFYYREGDQNFFANLPSEEVSGNPHPDQKIPQPKKIFLACGAVYFEFFGYGTVSYTLHWYTQDCWVGGFSEREGDFLLDVCHKIPKSFLVLPYVTFIFTCSELLFLLRYKELSLKRAVSAINTI